MVSGIHAFLLIYIRQEASGKKQTAGVELVVVLVFGIKAADMYVSQGMDEAFVAQVDADVRDAFFAVGCGFATEKDEVSALHVGEIRGYFNAFAYISLLRRISRDDYIVHKKHCPDQTAAIDSFRRSSRPQIRDSDHCIGGLNNAFDILFQ